MNKNGTPFIEIDPFVLDAAELHVGQEVIVDIEMVYGSILVHPIEEESHENNENTL